MAASHILQMSRVIILGTLPYRFLFSLILTKERSSLGITIARRREFSISPGWYSNYNSRHEENRHDDEGEYPLERNSLSEELRHTNRR